MARYYFHIRDGSRIIPDEEGMELEGVASAWAEAHASADDLAHQLIRTENWSIDIADYVGVVFGTVKVPELLRLA